MTVLSTGKMQVMTKEEANGNEKVKVVPNPNDTSNALDADFFAQSPPGTFSFKGYSGSGVEGYSEDSEDSDNDTENSEDSYDNPRFFVQSPPNALSIETSSEDSEDCENSANSAEDPEDSYDDFNNVFVGFMLSPTNECFAENYFGYNESYTDVKF